MSTQRVAWLIPAAAAVMLVAVGAVGRVERSRWIRIQNQGIAAVRASVASRFPHPSAWRGSPNFTCLIWRTSNHPYGRELCYAPSGAIIEAIERSPRRNPIVWTVRPEPTAARNRDDPRVVAALLDRLGAQTGPTIQIGKPDLGPR
jgi:hypothetical protein